MPPQPCLTGRSGASARRCPPRTSRAIRRPIHEQLDPVCVRYQRPRQRSPLPGLQAEIPRMIRCWSWLSMAGPGPSSPETPTRQRTREDGESCNPLISKPVGPSIAHLLPSIPSVIHMLTASSCRPVPAVLSVLLLVSCNRDAELHSLTSETTRPTSGSGSPPSRGRDGCRTDPSWQRTARPAKCASRTRPAGTSGRWAERARGPASSTIPSSSGSRPATRCGSATQRCPGATTSSPRGATSCGPP